VRHPIKQGGRFFQYRNGIDDFYWKGMSTRTDLGAQPVDRPRLVVNGRYLGGHIIAKPPVDQTPVAAVPYTTGYGAYYANHAVIPTFLAEHHSYSGVRLWFGADPPASGETGYYVGGHVGFVDNDWDPQYNDVAAYPHAFNFSPVLERFANFIYVGDYEALRRVYRVDVQVAPSALNTDYRYPADEIVAAYPGFVTTALHRHEGKLYYALADPAGAVNGYVYSWDGFESRLEYSLPVPGGQGVAMCSFRNTLVVTVRGMNFILVRTPAGVWSEATIGGFVASGFQNSMAELHEKLYIMSGEDVVYAWDGGALSIARTITGGTTPCRANCCVAFYGRLYYMWAEDLGGTIEYCPWLGVFDPDATDSTYSWVDDYQDFGYFTSNTSVTDGHDTDGDHPYLHSATPQAMAVYRQRIVVSIGTVVFGSARSFLSTHCVENNPYSTWHIIHSNPFSQTVTGPMYVSTWGNNTSIKYMKVL
jgi:hypothetical protein